MLSFRRRRRSNRKAELVAQRAQKFQELAARARQVEPGSREYRLIQNQSKRLSETVIDWGDAIADLRRALRARSKTVDTQANDLIAQRLPALVDLVRAKVAFTLPEAELVSGRSRASLYRAVRAGQLCTVSEGARRVILREDLETFLRAQRDLPESL